jgi:hypothetical protein
MLMTIITIFVVTQLAIAAVVLPIAYIRRHVYRRKMLSFCMRDSNGEIYIVDPQTGTAHNFSKLLTERMTPYKPRSPRQSKRARSRFRRHLAGAQ